jgi:hypothetical protein
VFYVLVIPASKKSLYHLAVFYSCFRNGNLISVYACLNVFGFILNILFVFPVLRPMYQYISQSTGVSIMLKAMPSSQLIGLYLGIVMAVYPRQLPPLLEIFKTGYTLRTAGFPRRIPGGPPVSPPDYGPSPFHERTFLGNYLGDGSNVPVPALESVKPGLLSILE